MIKRAIPLPDRPDRSPWFRAELDGVIYTFRLPSYGQAQPAQVAVVAAQDEKDIAGIEAAFGDFAAMCWDDPVYEFENPDDGAAVFQELRDVGFTFRSLGLFFGHVSKLIQAELVTEGEVVGALRFFGPTEPPEPLSLRSA